MHLYIETAATSYFSYKIILFKQNATDVTSAVLTCAIFDSETSLERAIEKLWILEEYNRKHRWIENFQQHWENRMQWRITDL